MYNVPGIELLNKIGKSWFVSYKYYELIDKKELGWQKCNTVEMRKSFYDKTREYHLEWLKYIMNASENRLSSNKLSICGFDITVMACMIYEKLIGISH